MILTDTQSIMLSSAGRRDSGSIFPLPDIISAGPGPIAKSLKTMAKLGLVEERETMVPEEVSRVDGITRHAMYITAAGRAAIGLEEELTQLVEETPAEAPAPKQTKAALVMAMLSRPDGATLAELVAATNWLQHTTRAVLTGIRKKGCTIEKTRRDNATCYRIVEAA